MSEPDSEIFYAYKKHVFTDFAFSKGMFCYSLHYC